MAFFPDEDDPIKRCFCGSGLHRYELRDAAGLFCTFVCDKCEDRRRKEFNPAIFDECSPYASSGEEEDIGRRYDERGD